jgi:hypothetical protein
MSNASAYVVEVDGQTAGLAVVEPRGFRFFAATHRAWSIDGQTFRSLAAVNAAAARLMATSSLRGFGPSGSLLRRGELEHREQGRAAA